jgi:hypothetical protein
VGDFYALLGGVEGLQVHCDFGLGGKDASVLLGLKRTSDPFVLPAHYREKYHERTTQTCA